MATKISVLLVTYNLEQYVADAIESCLSQELLGDKKLELIIGDDGSSDHTVEIIKDYYRRYPQIIKYFVVDRAKTKDIDIPILRQSNVFRKALGLSTGDYIQFLDGDDYLYDTNKLNAQADFLDNNLEYGSCYTDYRMLYEDTCSVQDEIIRYNPGNKLFWSSNYAPATCFLFRKEIKQYLLENIISDTGITYAGLCIGNCKHISSIGFVYRKRAESMSTLDIMRKNIYEILVAQDCLKSKNMRLYTKARYNCIFKYCYDNYHFFIESGLYKRAKKQTCNGLFFNRRSNNLFSDKSYLLILFLESFLIRKVVRCIRKASLFFKE